MAKIHFTQHAIERFVLRHNDQLSLNEAFHLLENGLNRVSRLREKTFRGQDQWQMEDPSCVLVTKYTPSGIVCVTILPEAEAHGIPEEELELMRDYALGTSEWGKLEEIHEVVDKAIDAMESPSVSNKHRRVLIRRIVDAETKAASLWRHIVQMYVGMVKGRKAEGMAQQVARVREDHRKAVQGLRLALQYMVLGGVSSREEVLRAIASVDPAFLTTAFIDPTSLTSSERKEEILRVRGSNSMSLAVDNHGHREGDS